MKETKFKQTEVGMIPSDWNYAVFGNLVYICRGGSPRPIDAYITSNPSGINWIKIGDVAEGDKYITSTKERIIPEGKKSSREVHSGDFILSNSMSFGRPYILKIDGCIHDGWLAIQNYQDTFDTNFLYYLLSSENVYAQYVSMAAGSSVQNLNKEKVAAVKLSFPSSKKEQQRIANALSDVDTLISNLEKLIAKKKNIKQGAMQQLLTGKKRLPGFASNERTGSRPTDERRKECHSERSAKREESSGYKMTELGMIPSDWKVKTISQVGKNIGGGTPSTFNSAYWNGSVQWFTPAELSKAGKYVSKSERTITKLGVENCSAKILPAGTILLTTRASIGTSAILKAPACTNQGFQSLVVNSENSNEFLYYLLSTKVDEMMSLASGSTFLEISPKKLGGIQLQIPSSRAEQTAIANVLSDMDTEIATLETKLAKYRTLKTGMMQQLLTGKIRLIDAKPETASVENNRVVPVAFKRAVLAAEIAHRLCAEPTFGHVKMEKMLFLAEKMCELNINSSYHRDAAGPYDNRALRSIDSQLEKQKWFKFIRSDKGNHYIPLEKRGGHSQYFDRYYSECRSVFDNIINTFKTAKTEQCEIVATLYSAWEDFLNHGTNPTDDQIVTEVLTNWNESKKRISKERWIKALSWMKENSFVPRRT